ncbi:polysaccharide deacetylase family protein [Streptomyces sp. 549]|uniref:polysaccharide deacetylase family protein n=1 Tax=Streptomyces sp. 549 TaxID=3049076 RepID=UPI0024C2FBA3|nr:polysaccharide deacetylase family protein [Streptomyces sp. 549]MDK1475199.1 polysaccharide deacetylase family protein [Streptomyces sp. 549]
MIIPLRRVVLALSVLALTATAACGSTEAPASKAAAPQAVAPQQKAGPAADAAPQKPMTLPATASGRAAVFLNGPRDTADRTVALTFDADMTADQTDRAAGGERFDNPDLISVLRREKVPATVFMTGMWARTYPGQARSIGRDPLFEVGNHSFSHHAFTGPCHGLPVLDPGRQRAEVREGFAALRAAGVPEPVPYFRFPGGCHDDAALRAVGAEGATAIQWDVMSGDPFNDDADDVVSRVLDGVRPGSVVVMHCTLSAAPATAEAVRRLVPELRERGYRFVKVSDLVAASVS